MENRLIAILGCTASGKGALARALAEEINAEILSIDSMKVYRRMDIGTAKPAPEQRAEVPHHLIDVADTWEEFSVARYVELADAVVEQSHAKGRPIVAVGGTSLYFKCFYQGLFEGPSADPDFRTKLRRRAETEGLAALHAELTKIDPAAADRIHVNDIRRIERALEIFHLTGRPISALQKQWDQTAARRGDWNWTLIGLRRPKEIANHRINDRVRRMIETGLIEEARTLWSDPRGLGTQARQAVGYAELFEHFEGRCTQEEAIEKIKINSRRLAKHQRTWLKRLPDIHWLDTSEDDSLADLLSQALQLVPDSR